LSKECGVRQRVGARAAENCGTERIINPHRIIVATIDHGLTGEALNYIATSMS
jgi:hypothetical protein